MVDVPLPGQTPPIENTHHARRIAIVVAVVGLMLLAAIVRLHGLAELDLFCDEALATEIAASFWRYGELNPFRYSRFLPDYFFRDGTILYFPPLSYVVAAPFTALRDSVGPNVAARLPAVLGGVLLIGLLIPAARTIFGDAKIGLAAAALTVCNGFHVGMSRMALPYSLLPPLLLLALLALLRALRRDRVVDWIAAAVTLAATVFVNQIALLFWPMFAPCALAAVRPRRALRRLVICVSAAGAAFLLWVVAIPRTASFASRFLHVTDDYGFTAQLAKLANPYRQMLAPWPLALAFALGFACLSVEVVRRRDATKATLLVWLALPSAVLLTRSMWILDYHLYAAYPPVILVTAYGLHIAVRAVTAPLATWRMGGRATNAVFVGALVALCWSEWRFAPPTPARSAHEFGDARIVSEAVAHIKRHDRGEPVIAPIGLTEAYYLERFVHSKNRDGAVARCLDMLRDAPAWVFMGDNYFHGGQLDACDEYVRERGTLIVKSMPIAGFTDPANSPGYALYYLPSPDQRAQR